MTRTVETKIVTRNQAQELNAQGWHIVMTTKAKRPCGQQYGTWVIGKNTDIAEFNKRVEDFEDYAWGGVDYKAKRFVKKGA